MADATVTVAPSGADYTSATTAINSYASEGVGIGDTYTVQVTGDITEDIDADVEGSGIILILEGDTDVEADYPVIDGGIFVAHNDIQTTIRRLNVTGGYSVGGGVIAGIWGDAGTTTNILTVARCVVEGIVGAFNSNHLVGIGLRQMAGQFLNCKVRNLSRDTTGSNNRNVFGYKLPDGSRVGGAYGCAADDLHNNGGTSPCYAFDFTDNGNVTIRNCAGSDVTHGSTGTAQVFEHDTPANADVDYCASDDSSHSGVNSVAVNRATDYEDAAGGDLTLASGSALEGEGEDQGTTPTGVNIAIGGRDRDAQGDTWDISPYQVVAGGGSDIAIFRRRIES